MCALVDEIQRYVQNETPLSFANLSCMQCIVAPRITTFRLGGKWSGATHIGQAASTSRAAESNEQKAASEKIELGRL